MGCCCQWGQSWSFLTSVLIDLRVGKIHSNCEIESCKPVTTVSCNRIASNVNKGTNWKFNDTCLVENLKSTDFCMTWWLVTGGKHQHAWYSIHTSYSSYVTLSSGIPDWISHEWLVFSPHTHKSLGERVYQEITSSKWDISWASTWCRHSRNGPGSYTCI